MITMLLAKNNVNPNFSEKIFLYLLFVTPCDSLLNPSGLKGDI